MKRKSHRRDDPWAKGLSGKEVGDYILHEFVGNGGIGYVYRASHREIPDSSVAVKLIFTELKPDWQVEVRKVSKLTGVRPATSS